MNLVSSDGDMMLVQLENTMLPALPNEAVRAVLLLFRADGHRPALRYNQDASTAAISCALCSSVIRWKCVEGNWKPNTSGYLAGRRCGSLLVEEQDE